MELDDLFYKRYNSLDELKDDLYNVERRLFIKELDGYDVPDPEDVLEHLEASNIDDMEKDWEEEREDDTNLTFEEFIGDEVNRYLMDEKGMGYESISRANSMQIGRDFIQLEKIYNGIDNL
jgi:vacuolar-type H+-ATPase subunit C/Vma6